MNAFQTILISFGLIGLVKLAKGSGNTSFEDIVDDLPKHPFRVYGKRNLSQIRYLVIHHTAADGLSPHQIARFHTESDHLINGGAAGIAYHFFIREDGKVFQTQHLETISWHVANNNTPSVGIVLSGNLDRKPPTKAQQKSVVELVRELKRMLPQTQIKRHGEFKNTNCPGHFMDMSIFN